MPRTIQDGDTTTQDANEVLVYSFDYDDNLNAGVVLEDEGIITITPTGGLGTDNVALEAGSRSVRVRVYGGRKGAIYEVRHTVSTTESPQPTKSKWFMLRIT